MNQCLFPVHISILIDAGVDPAERYKLEQAAVQLIMPYQGQKIRFYYVGTRYDQIRRKFIVNKGRRKVCQGMTTYPNAYANDKKWISGVQFSGNRFDFGII